MIILTKTVKRRKDSPCGVFACLEKGRDRIERTPTKIRGILQCGNGADAARKAGYSESYAAHRTDELLRNVEIAAYIKQLSEAAQTARIMTARDRQELLSDIAKDEHNDAADRIRAVDTLNKMTGEYTTKVEATVQPSEKLSDILSQLGGDDLDST